VINVFHATNVSLARSIQINGLGIDRNFYENCLNQLLMHFPLEKNKSEDYLERFFNEDASEINGGVSFFPTLQQCQNIKHQFNRGGEYLNLFIKRFLKYQCRVNKIPLTDEIKEIAFGIIMPDTTPCIIELCIPIELIFNKKYIGQGYELYTIQKVDPKYIVRLHF
jgi:hypothetical protein